MLTARDKSDLSHPGEAVADALEDAEITPAQLAQRTGQSPVYINRVIAGERPITENLARALGEILDLPMEYWLNLQAYYDDAVMKVDTGGLPIMDPGSDGFWDF